MRSVVPEAAKDYRKGEALRPIDYRLRVSNDRTRREVRALFSYFCGAFLPRRHDHLVEQLAVYRTRLLMAALYEHPGLHLNPKDAQEWLVSARSLISAAKRKESALQEQDAEAAARMRGQKPSTWRMKRSPGSYDPR